MRNQTAVVSNYGRQPQPKGDIFDQVSGAFDDLIPQPQPRGDIFDQVSGGAFDDLIPKPEGVLPHLSRRWTEGNRGVARANAGAELALVENYDVQGAAQDFARPRLPGDVEPASSAFLTEQTGNRQRFMEQKALLGGDVTPQQAREASALDAFETARNARANTLKAEIAANSPQPTEAGQVGPVTQFVGDVVGNAPRLARTMGVGVTTAGLGVVPYMGVQIFGEKNADYSQAGKDPHRSMVAAAISAIGQAPLESLPVKKLLDMLGSKGGKLAGIAKVMGAEGVTEYFQNYPDELADIYVDNPDASIGQLANMFWEKFKTGDFHKKALYEGAVGAVTGGGLAGVAAGVQRAAEGKQPQPQTPTGAESLHAVGDNQDAGLASAGAPKAPGSPTLLDRIIGAESSGNPNAKNPNSTARGLGQMIESTRNRVLELSGLDGWSQDQGEQRRAAEWLLNRNREQMAASLARDPSDAEQYVGWFLGPAEASRFIQAMSANPEDTAANHVRPEASRKNVSIFFEGDRPRTLSEVFALMDRKVGQGEAVAQAKPTGDVFDQVAQQEQPEGALGPISPELASLKEDIKARNPEISADPTWEVSTVQEAADKAAGVPQNMARENELRSLRAEIQARETQQRAREEQGMPAPVQQAARIESSLALPAGTLPPLDGGARSQVIPAIPLQGQQVPALPQGQGFEALPTPAQPDPATIPWKNLVFVAKDLGIEKPSKMTRPALIESVRQAQAAQMRATVQAPQDMRVQFRPEARTPAQFQEADALFSGPDTRFSAASRPAGSRLRTRDVASATAGFERAMPGAAPTRIIQTAQELPAHIQEQARSQGYSLGQIRGVHDPRTGSVYLVADNLVDPAEAGRIWLHEQLAHRGLWELFGSSAKVRSVLENIRKGYGLSSLQEAEEHIARIAEQLDAGKALSPKDGFHWRKMVDAVRSWLAEHGISVTRANLEAMLRKSARNLARSGDVRGQGMQEAAAFSQEREGMFSVREDTDAILPKLAASTDLGFFSRFLRTPEYQKHPVHKELYEIFRNRHERAHEIINSVMGDGQEASPIQAYDALTEKEQRLLDDAFTIADERFIGPEKMERWFKDQGIGERVVAVWRKMRRGYDRMLDHMLEGSIQELEKGNNPDVSYVDAAGKTVTMSLRDAVNEMRSLQGTYAPRIRPDGTYAVLAKRTDSEGNVEYARHHVEWQRQAGPVAKKLTAEGWTVTGFERISRLPEGVQQDLAKDMSSMAGAIGNAAQNMKNVTDEVRQEFITNLVSEVANEIKSRGLRSSTIRRTGKFGRSVKGYETNSKKRFAEYTTRTAFGLAKKESAQKALAALFATDADGKLLLSPSENPNAFSYAQAFIKEMLRNSEKADRVIGLAKSVATFKFMGFNPKSAALNLTTLVTQAPPALRVYATDSKAGLLKCTKYMIGASDAAVKFMLGKNGKGLTAGEKDFLDQIRRKELDAPQETRALSQVNASTVGKVWSESMSKAMLMFGATEQFNRISTLLAGYRLAIDVGYSHAEAMERAQLASDRAHGAYGREAMPEFTWGTGVGGMIGQLFYVYQKYTHNTYQLLTEVAGKRDARSFMMLLATPVILAGDKAGTTWLAWTVYNQFMKLISDDDREPREKLLAWIKDNLGGQAEDLVRFGIFGLLGVDVSGSMSSKVNVPTAPVELAGAVGGFVKDYLGPGGVVHLLATGQPGKALEKALPTGISKPFQAVRESVQGITDGKGHPLLDEQGKPYMPTPEETTAKTLGFRPAREARVRDVRSAAMAEERTFQDRRTSIFEEYRAWANGGRKPDALDSVVGKVREFNADVDRMDRPNISPITPRSLESQLVRMGSPSKKELGRMGIGEAAQVPELTEKEFAQAEARAAFKIEAKRINAAVEAYNAAQKAGNTAEAMRISKENDLARMRRPVKFTSERLSKINAARNALDANTKIDPATRDRWMRRYDEQEAHVLETFRKMYGGRR